VIEVAETGEFFAAPRHPHSQALVSAAIPCRTDGLWSVMGSVDPPGARIAGAAKATAGRSPGRRPDQS
jgi:ABC-type dipeptide/oligopeptide/nickel transport system ATPase component